MRTNKLRLKNSVLIASLILIILLSFGHVAYSIVRYPPVAALGVGDIKSSHIQDGTIVNVDISSNARISSGKMTFNSYTGVASSTWHLVMDYLAQIATTSNNMIVANGAGWVAMTTSTLFELLQLGTMAQQNSTSVAITAGSVTGITDLATADGGTGRSWNNATPGGLVVFNATGTLGRLEAGASGDALISAGPGADFTWGSAIGDGAVTPPKFFSYYQKQGATTTNNTGRAFDWILDADYNWQIGVYRNWATSTIDFSRFGFYLKKSAGSPTGPISFSAFSSTTGQIFASSTAVNAENLTSSYVLYFADFTPVSVRQAAVIAVSYDQGNSSNAIAVSESDSDTVADYECWRKMAGTQEVLPLSDVDIVIEQPVIYHMAK